MIGSLMMSVSVVVLLAGRVLGIAIGIREDFALQPARARLNLVDRCALVFVQRYYRLVPAAAACGLAKPQGWLHIIGGISGAGGPGLVVTRGTAIPIVGSLIMLAAMVLLL